MTGASSINSSGADLERLQQELGYRFKAPQLLQAALTHKSHSKLNNERLEFIGDAVLGYVVGVMLFRHDDGLSEDLLSLMRAKLVRGSTLAEVAREINLAPHLRLGSGERKSGGRQRDSILADAFEAVIGAIHEDSGIQACTKTVEKLFSQRVRQLDPENLKDAKTRLQEFLQARQCDRPEYSVQAVTGKDHERRYTVACHIKTWDITATAIASSRRNAEQEAAAVALAEVEQDKKVTP